MANNDLIENQKTGSSVDFSEQRNEMGKKDVITNQGIHSGSWDSMVGEFPARIPIATHGPTTEYTPPTKEEHEEMLRQDELRAAKKKSDEPAWKPLNLADLKFERIVEKFSLLLGREFIADVRLSEDEIAKAYFIDIRLQLYILGIGDRIVKYPDGWIEAMKDRWLPHWIRRRWPVKYKVFDAFAYWPTLHKYLPDALKGAPGGAMFRESTGGLE